MKTLFFVPLFVTLLIVSTSANGQISGNQVYDNSYNRYDNENFRNPKSVIVKDSVMYVSADILLNARADSFVVTLGLSQEATTIKDCNLAINKRINSFISSLKKIGITETDTYIDFITQTKVYTYKVAGNLATQKFKGFEIKKNIIIKIPASATFDKIIDLASENAIYDVVKVDYINTDMQAIYAEMMEAGSKIIKQKKDIYLNISPVTILPVSKIVSEAFYAVYPNSQYKVYQAFETSEVIADNDEARSNFIKNDEKKDKTFYYQKIDQSGFDQVINNATPVVGIQYVLKIQMEFDIKRK